MRNKRTSLIFIVVFVLTLIISTACNNNSNENEELEFYDFGDLYYYEAFVGNESNNLSRSRIYDLQFFSNKSLTHREDNNGGTEIVAPYIIEPIGKNVDKISIKTSSQFQSSTKPFPKESDPYSKYYYTLFRIQLDFSENYSYTEELVEIDYVKMNVFGEIYDAPVNINVQLVPDDITSKFDEKFNYVASFEANESDIAIEAGGARLRPISLSSNEKIAYKKIYVNTVDNIEIDLKFKSLEIFNTIGGELVETYYDSDLNNLTNGNGEYIYCYSNYNIYIQFEVEILGALNYKTLCTPIYGEIYFQDTDEIVTVPIGFFKLYKQFR